ncbi:LytTR family transcriptional regulator [Clostridiaceae bacterium OttesenSCG-928-D20]|nr:LytTR family transcriptional regulator [Clostridiaceae bacterium OttesenSCG-928-D20]
MKIIINENPQYDETEVIINCRQTDEQILRICAGLRMADKKVTGIQNGQTFVLSVGEVLYIETVDRKTFLYTTKQIYETPLKLYELEEQLASEDFIRASKSCILNFDKVKAMRGDIGGRLLCTLENGEIIPASRQYALAIKRKLGIMKGASK